jgi:hypothetical protein
MNQLDILIDAFQNQVDLMILLHSQHKSSN